MQTVEGHQQVWSTGIIQHCCWWGSRQTLLCYGAYHVALHCWQFFNIKLWRIRSA